jgi:hypothetical protein
MFLETPKRGDLVQTSEQRLHARITGRNIGAIDKSYFENARNLPLLRPHLMLRGKPAKKREGSGLEGRGRVKSLPPKVAMTVPQGDFQRVGNILIFIWATR